MKLGNPNLAAIRGSGGEAGKAEAERFAGMVLPIIKQVKKAGATTLQQIADALNDRRRGSSAWWQLVSERRAERPGPSRALTLYARLETGR